MQYNTLVVTANNEIKKSFLPLFYQATNINSHIHSLNCHKLSEPTPKIL